MEKLHFDITINATPEKVWNSLWEDQNYRTWTAAFAEGSYAKSDWKKGSKILFLGPDGSGMVARIEESIPNKFMSFEHLGEIKNGTEDLNTAKVQGWSGAHENYTLTADGTGTKLQIDMDTVESFKEMFAKMWPKALAKLKSIAEN